MADSESTPLVQSKSQPKVSTSLAVPHKPHRSVTFSPTVATSSPSTASSLRPSQQAPGITSAQPGTAGQPLLSTINSRLRRRNSHGNALTPPQPQPPKFGPQRTTRTAQKLKLLPNPEQSEEGPDEESGREVYAQFTRIKDPTARRDAARLGKADRERLPRVTAYCTANAYRMDDLMRFLKGRGKLRGAAPKRFDECIYTPFNYHYGRSSRAKERDVDYEWGQKPRRRYSDSAVELDHHDEDEERRDDLIDLHTQAGDTSLDVANNHTPSSPLQPRPPSPSTSDFHTTVHTPEVFLFAYGAVVIWGMTVAEEQRFLHDMSPFSTEPLSPADVQVENFNFYYTREYQARIYNDFISLRSQANYMIKLALSHALAQSVKTSLYEDLVDNTIATTKEIPAQIARTGKVALTRRQINMQIGELFILRINIHLQGSVLDSPELMWAEPQLEPVYAAVRAYLEMDQRVGLLTERLEVIADLLAVLKDQLTHTHGEYLEWIVIVLIAAEILVAAVNILVDLYAGVD